MRGMRFINKRRMMLRKMKMKKKMRKNMMRIMKKMKKDSRKRMKKSNTMKKMNRQKTMIPLNSRSNMKKMLKKKTRKRRKMTSSKRMMNHMRSKIMVRMAIMQAISIKIQIEEEITKIIWRISMEERDLRPTFHPPTKLMKMNIQRRLMGSKALPNPNLRPQLRPRKLNHPKRRAEQTLRHLWLPPIVETIITMLPLLKTLIVCPTSSSSQI